MRRYTNSTIYSLGQARGASKTPGDIKAAIDAGAIGYSIRVVQEGERLDTIAGQVYGDSTLWWVIASASGIGWALQVPPGTRLIVPDASGLARIA